MEFLEINSKNMFTLFLHMADFIYNRKLEGKIKKDILVLEEFGEVTWFFILSMHKAGWDTLKTNKRNRTFCQSVTSKFTLKIKNNISNKKNKIPKKERKVYYDYWINYHIFLRYLKYPEINKSFLKRMSHDVTLKVTGRIRFSLG